MGFQRVGSIRLMERTIFGANTDCLYSDEVSAGDLRQWVRALRDWQGHIGSDAYGVFDPHRREFSFDFFAFCIHIALSDGKLTDREIEGIRQLSGGNFFDREFALHMSKVMNERSWASDYPPSFKSIVRDSAKSGASFDEIGDLAKFFFQVAAFVHSIDNATPYDDRAKTYEYVKSFRFYIERVSAIDFEVPDDEGMEEVCRERDRLAREYAKSYEKRIQGTWGLLEGSASAGIPSNFTLERGGVGYVSKKKLFGTRKASLKWMVKDMDSDLAALIFFSSSPETFAMGLPMPDGQMHVTFKSGRETIFRRL